MARRERRPHAIDMYRAITQLQTEEECFAFFQDICSNKEMLAMEQRFRVAQMAGGGKGPIWRSRRRREPAQPPSAASAKVLNEGTGVVAGILERKQEQDAGQKREENE